jgi:hypothetical protein
MVNQKPQQVMWDERGKSWQRQPNFRVPQPPTAAISRRCWPRTGYRCGFLRGPSSVHDFTTARLHALPALYYAAGLTALADPTAPRRLFGWAARQAAGSLCRRRTPNAEPDCPTIALPQGRAARRSFKLGRMTALRPGESRFEGGRVGQASRQRILAQAQPPLG